jgi:hypothetical protein
MIIAIRWPLLSPNKKPSPNGSFSVSRHIKPSEPYDKRNQVVYEILCDVCLCFSFYLCFLMRNLGHEEIAINNGAFYNFFGFL